MSFGKSGLRVIAAFALLVSLFLMGMGASAAEKNLIVLRVLHYLDATSPGAHRELIEVWRRSKRRTPTSRSCARTCSMSRSIRRRRFTLPPASCPTSSTWRADVQRPCTPRSWSRTLRRYSAQRGPEFSEAALCRRQVDTLAELLIGVTSSHVLYVNQKVLRDLGLTIPKSYEELKAMAPKLKAAGKDVVLMGAQDDWVMQSCLYSAIVGRMLRQLTSMI